MEKSQYKLAVIVMTAVFLISCGGGGSSNLGSNSSAVSANPNNSESGDGTSNNKPLLSSVSAEFYDLPGDWQVIPVQSQNCSVSSLGGVENVYTETASKLFTWLTGTVDEAHYEPIGEVANYFGFAALRNELRDTFGEGADQGFRGAAYREVLELLDERQRGILYDLLDEHSAALTGFLADRILLINELWAIKENQVLDLERVEELILSVGQYEGEITRITAEKYAEVIALLTPAQQQYLEDMRTLTISVDSMQNSVLSPYGAAANSEFDALNELEAEYMTEVSSKIVSWATGEVADSVYLPTGKISNFFGFANYRYVDNTGVSRSDAAGFVDSVITQEQQEILCGLSTNVVGYTNDYIDGRANLIAALDFLRENPALATTGQVEAYTNLAGVGEGRRAVIEALTFHLIEATMSQAQIQTLIDIRRAN